jgi:hypothetical protein
MYTYIANISLMKRLVSLNILISTTFVGYSQDDGKGTIDPQRPTLSESYSIIIPNMIQFENGLDYYGDSNTFSYGTFIRGSVTRRVELRAFTDYQHLNTVGAKFIVMEPDGSALGIGASFVYTRDLMNDYNDFRVAMTKAFKSVFVTYNFGYNVAIYNIVLLGVPIGDNVSYFVEYYIDPEMNRIHSGFTWIPIRDIQLDLNGGWMDTDGWYAGLGVSFRLR